MATSRFTAHFVFHLCQEEDGVQSWYVRLLLQGAGWGGVGQCQPHKHSSTAATARHVSERRLTSFPSPCSSPCLSHSSQ